MEVLKLTDWVNIKPQVILSIWYGPVVPAEEVIYRFRRFTDTVAQHSGTTTV